jgi:hypothetical protein
MKHLFVSLFCLSAVSLLSVRTAHADGQAGVMSAVTTTDEIVVQSKGGSPSYRAVVDGKRGGNIAQVSLPAGVNAVVRDLNDIFFHGTHGDQYSLRGWTGRSNCILSCAMKTLSRKPDEIVVQVDIQAAGTFKILTADETIKAKLKGRFKNYTDRTVDIKRVYTFKPDRIVMNDDILWVYPDMEITTVYVTSSFLPRCVQSPARLVKGAVKADFHAVGSGGGRIPKGITYPFTAENLLKHGYKVSMLTREASFDLGKSDLYFYEKPWQQDWNQLSGFMYNLRGYPKNKLISLKNEVVFSKAETAEMPPVVTIQSPAFEARWMDEKGEVAKYKIGDTVKFIAAAVNSDGSAVPDKDISWEIHIDPWWKTPSTVLEGGRVSYILPQVANAEDKTTSQGRDLLAVIKVKAKGKNGTEAIEQFAMLVGK